MHVCVPACLFIFVPTHNAYMCSCVLVYKYVGVVWISFTQCCSYFFISSYTLLNLYYKWKVQVRAWPLHVYWSAQHLQHVSAVTHQLVPRSINVYVHTCVYVRMSVCLCVCVFTLCAGSPPFADGWQVLRHYAGEWVTSINTTFGHISLATNKLLTSR